MALPIPQGSGVNRLREIVKSLRAPGGCPWDIEQTHESLLPNLLEEAYEVVDAIKSNDSAHMAEELGDLLLQVVMHAEIASERDAFDFDQLADGISEKLIRRHPHVFGESDATSTEAVLKQWDEIKAEEKKGQPERGKGYLEGVGEGLPALYRATKLQKKAAKVGFDWETTEPILEKLREEVEEVAEALAEGERVAIEDEVGDLLFVVVNLARKLKLDPELALHQASQKFARRFHHIESNLTGKGGSLEAASLEEMEAEWNDAKRKGL